MKKFLLAMIAFSCLPLIALPQVNEPSKNQEQKQDKKSEKELVWQYGSIIYNKEQINWLEQALKSYVEGIPISTLLPNIFPPDGGEGVQIDEPTDPSKSVDVTVQQALIAPVFHLDSILYIASDNWSVWFGGKKLSFGGSVDVGVDVGKLEIANVTENNVSMVWSENRIERIFSKWRSYFEPLGDSRFASNNKNIVVDLKSGDVSFILGVNQSLDTATMQITEGEIKANENSSVPKDTLGDVASQEKNLANEPPRDVVAPAPFENNAGDSLKPDLESTEDYAEQLQSLKKILINNR
jgi:hypothetical protein